MKDDEFGLLRPTVLVLCAALTLGFVVRTCRDAARQRAQCIRSLVQTAPVPRRHLAPNTNDCPAKCAPAGKATAVDRNSPP